MSTRRLQRLVLPLVAGLSVVSAAVLAIRPAAHAQPPATGSKPAPAGAAAAPTNCKSYAGGKCCSPEVTAHLTKEAVFAACGESDATYLGEKPGSDECKYYFKIEGKVKEEAFVGVWAPKQKDIPSEPEDLFYTWKRIGKVWVTDKAKSPKSAAMVAAATGIWLPGKGFMVSVNASSKVCTKPEAMSLAKSVK